MKRVFLLSLLLLLGATVVNAEDLTKPFMERMAGQWHSKLTAGDFKGFGLLSARFSEDRTALLARELIVPLDQSAVWHGMSILQPTETPNTFRECYSAQNGTQLVFEFTIAKEGNAFVGKGRQRGFGADGKVRLGDLTISVDEQSVTWKVSNRKNGGKDEPDLIMQFSRVKFDEPAAAEQDQKVRVPTEVLQGLDYFVGDWKAEARIGDEKSEGEYSFQWAPGRHCLTYHGTWSDKQGKSSCSSLMGWDISTKEIIDVNLDSLGANYTLRYKVASSTSWTGEARGTDENGKAVKGTLSLEKKGSNAFVWKNVNRTADGTSQPDVVLHFKKK
jgi:hypothetical protein